MENGKERLPDFSTQLLLALFRPIVRCASNPGDLVIDPFCGSGTTGLETIQTNRKLTGIERSQEFIRNSRLRLSMNTKR